MAGLDKLIFLFRDNEKIDVNKTSVSFIFGDSPPPHPTCFTNPKIDYSNNTFTSCGCNYINYEDNVFQQRCVPPPPPDCSTDLYFDPVKTSFTYNCICDERTESTDFLINCSTVETGEDIDIGLTISNYGYASNTAFSIDFYNVENLFGYNSDVVVNVADMRFPHDYGYGFESTTTVYKFTYLDNDLTYGHQVNALISYGNNNFTQDINSYYGQDVNSVVVFNPYNEFDREISSYYGQDAENTLITFDDNRFTQDVNSYYGQSVNVSITFDDNRFTQDVNSYYGQSLYTTIIYDDNKFETNVDINYGYQSDAVVIYSYPNPFDIPVIGYLGFESTTLVTFGVNNPFPTIIVSNYGFESTFSLNTKLVEDLIDFNKTIDLSYGHSVNSFLLYNAYNPILVDGTTSDSQYGHSTNATIRYSDDPYINDVNSVYGFDSISELDTQVGLYTFASDFEYGIEQTTNLEYTIGFSADAYHGVEGRLLYVANLHTPVYFDVDMRFGHMMYNNHYDVRTLDLMRKECCVFHKTDLAHIEMMDEPDYNRQYEDVDAFSCKVEIMLCTQPRFSGVIYQGMKSDIVDHSQYLKVDFNYGVVVNVRNMEFDSTIDLVGGNFIVDQNEIKVEMTKPEDVISPSYGLIHGFMVHSDISTERAYVLTSVHGFQSTFDMYYDSPIRPYFWWGYHSRSELATWAVFNVMSPVGFECRTTFYEPPTDFDYGMSSYVDEIYTENFVEFIDDGEIKNEYIHQTPNGDPDLLKPNGESLEGYVYTHYIKGRCF